MRGVHKGHTTIYRHVEGVKRMTTNEMILDYLQHYGPLTSAKAFEEIGTLKLTTRISELRREGYLIFDRPIKKKNRWGKTITYNEYSMGAAS